MPLWIAGGAILGGLIGAAGSTSAANTQANASQNAANLQYQMFNQISGREQPFVNAGYGALNQLDYLMGIPGQSGGTGYGSATGAGAPTGNAASLGGVGGDPRGGSFGGAGFAQLGPGAGAATLGTNPAQGAGGSAAPGGYGSLNQPFTADMMQQYSPAYGFQLQQGRQATLNQGTSGQGAGSGSALKDLISFNQNYANTAFSNAFNQYQTQNQNVYNRLSGLTQIGSSAAANLGAQGVQLAGNAGSAVANVGAAQAAGTIGATNAITGGITNAIPWLYAANQGNTTGGVFDGNTGQWVK